MPAPAPAPRRALSRSIRFGDATAMVVGIIIGASIFVQPSEMTGAVPSLPGLLAAWSIAGLLTLGGALICAELSSAFPRTGGVYVYLSETVSPAIGFLWAWAMFWSMHSGIIAPLAVGLMAARRRARPLARKARTPDRDPRLPRRSPEGEGGSPAYMPSYRVPGYPVVPIVFAVVSSGVVLNRLAVDLSEALTGLAIVLAGLPFCWAGARRRPGDLPGGQ
jgi:amino acid transporter